MNTLAIDPSTKAGYAWTNGQNLDYGLWRFTGEHPGQAPDALYGRILEYAETHRIERIATEGGYPISRRGADRLEWLRGAVHMAGAALGVPVIVVAPSSLKLFATGNGRAKKPDMIHAVERHLGIVTTDDNIADALMILEWAKGYREPFRPAKQAARKRKAKPPKLF